jgi:hypothetical protein
MVWATVAGRVLPGSIDAGWRARWQGRAGGPLPASWFEPEQPGPAQQRAAAANRHTVDAVLAGIPWLH